MLWVFFVIASAVEEYRFMPSRLMPSPSADSPRLVSCQDPDRSAYSVICQALLRHFIPTFHNFLHVGVGFLN